jgi:hypothetical protein
MNSPPVLCGANRGRTAILFTVQGIFFYLHDYKVESSSHVLIYDANKKSLKTLKE